MGIFKKENANKKVLVFFHGFNCSENLSEIINYKESEYDVELPNLYAFFGDSEVRMDIWIRNCRVYLGELSKKYEDITLLGFSMGAIIAGNCASLPFVKKIILVEVAYWFLEYQGDKRVFYYEQINSASKIVNVSSTIFSIIYAKLVGSFENHLKQSNADILILQDLDEYSLETKRISHIYQYLDKNKVKLIQIGTEKQGLVLDEKTRTIVELLVNNFVGI